MKDIRKGSILSCLTRVFKLALIGAFVALLAGCLYPDSERGENRVAGQEYVILVQTAVDQYHKDTGLLPIKNSEMDTPIYEKYVIDFRKLRGQGYIGQIPANAYENGGTSFYVLINVEENAKVMLMDLITFQKVGDLQKKVNAYKDKHSGTIPKGERVVPGFYNLDFEKMGLNIEQTQSLYSQQFLGYIIHDSGKVAVDYGLDIMKAINKKGLEHIAPNKDLRAYLVEESLFVPVSSFPYYLHQGEPRIAVE